LPFELTISIGFNQTIMMEGFAARTSGADTPIFRIAGKKQLDRWLASFPGLTASKERSKFVKAWIDTSEFVAKPGQHLLVPDKDGRSWAVLVGVNEEDVLWQCARLPFVLPRGKYSLADCESAEEATALCCGWGLGTYQFDRYKRGKRIEALLVWPALADKQRVTAIVEAAKLGRDLINTPAEDMGPDALASVAKAVAAEGGASYREIVGQALLEQNFPSIHSVGRAAAKAPRLIDFTWGKPDAPKVTLVGKGVCFDTGGLDIKPADAMKLMKKDMGGAACTLAIAKAVMQLRLPVRLRVLIPAVENNISGNAFRPLDVLNTRKGFTVEVGNTDAEGRLVLSDALTEADSERPSLIIDIATLTGAARVALGTELPALFSSSDEVAGDLLAVAERERDPMWRLPLHKPYRRLLESKVADLSNVSAGPYAGAITAALFLQEFVSPKTPWVHIDSMAFNIESLPGRPYGGEVLTMRAIVSYLEQRFGKGKK
jgi:leucyl aminopeptidase